MQTSPLCRAGWENLHCNIFHLQDRLEGLMTAVLQTPKCFFWFFFAIKDYYHLFLRFLPAPQLSCRLTGELQSEALLAGEEVRGELHADGVEGAVGVLGHRRATQLSQ